MELKYKSEQKERCKFFDFWRRACLCILVRVESNPQPGKGMIQLSVHVILGG